MTEIEMNDAFERAFERAEKIDEQLKRIADALELLASAVQPQFKDRDATLNVQAVCYNQEI
jgi:mRNA-degrading endonuclease YafQ of YafQ-DinJ toxin-antitoxin module